MSTEDIVARIADGVSSIAAEDWDRCAGPGNPFLSHAFLSSLEDSGSATAETGWQPVPLVIHGPDGKAAAVLPAYAKSHSQGEYVFDHGWADAYMRAGGRYYPKLQIAVPFTPVPGRRLLTTDPAYAPQLIAAAESLVNGNKLSSAHATFITEEEAALFEAAGWLIRVDSQFHWHNDGYADFDDFLGRFSSMKRKKAKRERRRVAEAQIAFEHLRGDEPTRAEWDAIFQFYSHTFERRGRPPYLNREFFAQVATTMPENLVIVLARYRAAPIAAAICFRGGGTLYGRYWGSLADFHSLHFETCYYQGIEYCIRERLQKFEPGTQGEHKISRGFTPSATWSCHWLRDPDFHGAVADFLRRETRHVDAYMDELDEHVPYRDAAPAPPLGSPGDRSGYPVIEPPG